MRLLLAAFLVLSTIPAIAEGMDGSAPNASSQAETCVQRVFTRPAIYVDESSVLDARRRSIAQAPGAVMTPTYAPMSAVSTQTGGVQRNSRPQKKGFFQKLLSPIIDPILDPITGQLSATTETLRGLSDPITGLRDPLTNLSEPIGSLRDPLTNLSEPIGSLRDPLTNLQQPLSDLQQPLTDLNQPLSDLNRPLSDLRQPINDLRHPINNLRQPINQLQQPVAGLSRSAASLQAPMVRISSDLARLHQPLSGISEPLNGMQQPLRDLVSPLRGLQQPLAGLQSPLNNLQAEMHSLRKQIDTLHDTILEMGRNITLAIVFGCSVVAYAIWTHRKVPSVVEPTITTMHQVEREQASGSKATKTIIKTQPASQAPETTTTQSGEGDDGPSTVQQPPPE